MLVGIEGRNLQGKRFGVGRYLVNLLRQFASIGGENRYLVYLSEPIEPLDFSSSAINYVNLGKAPSIMWRHLRLPLAMRRDKIDLHFSPSYFLPLIKVCPSVVVIHDIISKVHPEWFVRDRRLLFEDLFLREVRRAERIVTVSEYSKRDIVEVLKVDASKVVAVPNAPDEIFRPVEDEQALREVRERYGLREGFIFTVGAIHTRRNLIRLIEAVALAEKKLRSELQLLVIGEPAPFSPPVDLRGAARRCGLEERMVHVEYVSDQDLLLLYNACGLFAYPSLYEGFGLPVIEAMACGTPVACSRATSLPEVAGEAAVYFDPNDAEDIAEALVKILSSEELKRELSRAGIERASTFSWRRTAEEILGVFEEIVGQGAR